MSETLISSPYIILVLTKSVYDIVHMLMMPDIYMIHIVYILQAISICLSALYIWGVICVLTLYDRHS